MSRAQPIVPVLVLSAAACWAVACGDGTTEPPPPTPPPPDPPRATTVAVTPATAELTALGETARFSAQVLDQNGQAMAGATVAWSSGDVSVATVDASGLATATGEGVATITASSGIASGTAEITVTDPDRAALVALYNATDGPNWVDNENWLSDAPLGEWYGVETDASGRVVRLDLSGRWDNETREYKRHGLSGSLPAQLGELSNLSSLDLGTNRLTGPIPAELASLANLRWLRLWRNELSGPIPPELTKLSRLSSLDLGGNRLTGPVPAELSRLADLRYMSFWGNELSGPIPPELANLSNLSTLSLGSNRLTGSIPAELGSLAHLEALYLNYNDLSGPIPAELGNLPSLGSLNLAGNALTGPIPQTLLQLELSVFYIENNETLCVPGSSVFVSWFRGIEHRDDDSESLFCNAIDATVLGQLYELAGGTGWIRSAGWAGDGALEERHGVSTDSLGWVTALDLTANGLAGRLPPTLGELSRMTELRIADNPGLSGRLPQSLANVSLQTLHYSGTGLCSPAETSFRDWLNTVSSHDGTGAECEPLSDREILEVLYGATGGLDWFDNENWLTDAPLADWHGVEVVDDDRVTALWLSENNLTGPIPPELGDLADLVVLSLWGNNLTGPIPPALGNLADLLLLDVDENDLSGSIPPELGGLASLLDLFLEGNDLVGPIPPEIGELAKLRRLALARNRLSGPIPPELGRLFNLGWLNLAQNRLSGAIPPELSGLAVLEGLHLGGNDLTGPIRPELGRLAELRHLGVSNNAGLTGVLPAELTTLQLESFAAGGTDLCAPSDPVFLDWLESIHRRRVVLCAGAAEHMVYLTQAVQSREWPVPLVAGEEALLRVFVTAARGTGEGIPPVRARFYVDGAETHVVDIPAGSTAIPTEIDEGALHKSANAEIPGELILPGLEMVIEIDPGGTLDPELGVAKRIPETGRLAVDVRAMPLFDLTLVPFLWTEAPDSTIIESVEAIAGDPDHELFWGPEARWRTTLPVGDSDVRAHEPVLSSSNSAFDLLRQTRAIRTMEGGTGRYMGAIAGAVTGAVGVAYLGGRDLFSLIPGPTVHELGHSFNLDHAPCGGAGGPDPSYPYPGAEIGAWGYDPVAGVLVPPTTTDLMSYCGGWISDYHFTNALRYRLFDEGPGMAAAMAAPARSLLLWGGTDADGVPFLEPAFVIDASPTLPGSAGSYRLTGRTGSGAELFSFSFAMPEIADGDGSSNFIFAIPPQPGWETLASITLTGPDGSVTLDGDSDRPMAILRNPRIGTVRGILRDLEPEALARAMAASLEAGLEVRVSRGLPTWR